MIAAIRIPTPEEIRDRRARLGYPAPAQRPRPQIALVKPCRPIPVILGVVEKRKLEQEDWHVKAWLAWKAWRGDDMHIMQYIRAACWMAGTNLDEVRSDRRHRPIVAKRHAVIKSACHRFPETSQSKMGLVFEKDHTVIGWILRNKSKRERSDRKFSGANNGCAKFTNDDILMIRDECKIGGPYRPWADRFQVTTETIRNIVTRKTWKHLA